MKRIIILIVCFNSFVLCNAIAQENDYQEDVSWDIADLVDRYYYTYFEYPCKTENLIDFAWELIKSNLECFVLKPYNGVPIASVQYQDFVTSSHSFMNVLKYLEANKQNIMIEVGDKYFDLLCGVDSLFVNYTVDACDDLEQFDSKLFRHNQRIFFYDKNNKELVKSDYNLELAELIKSVRNNFVKDKSPSKKFQNVFVKYVMGDNRLTFLCPIKEPISDSGNYLMQLPLLLDDFLKDKEIHSVILLLLIDKGIRFGDILLNY
ncbi:hypothetical protein [Bacteroides sp.]